MSCQGRLETVAGEKRFGDFCVLEKLRLMNSWV